MGTRRRALVPAQAAYHGRWLQGRDPVTAAPWSQPRNGQSLRLRGHSRRCPHSPAPSRPSSALGDDSDRACPGRPARPNRFAPLPVLQQMRGCVLRLVMRSVRWLARVDTGQSTGQSSTAPRVQSSTTRRRSPHTFEPGAHESLQSGCVQTPTAGQAARVAYSALRPIPRISLLF